MKALLGKDGESRELGLQIIQGDLDRAINAIEAHPLWAKYETKRDDFVIEVPEGGYWDNGNGSHFCCDCLDGAKRQARWEYKAKGLNRNRFDVDGLMSNLSETTDFEYCAVCYAHFEYMPRFTSGFSEWDYGIDKIRNACGEILHELHKILESNCDCVYHHGTYENKKFSIREVVLRWKIARRIIKAFESGYDHVVIEPQPMPSVCKEFADDYFQIKWEDRTPLLEQWGKDYRAMRAMSDEGAVERLTVQMCMDVAKFSGKTPADYYRQQFHQNSATSGKKPTYNP